MDFFSVPYRLIWRWFDQFYTNVKDINTAYSPVDPATTPKDLHYLLGSDIGTYLNHGLTDQFGFPVKHYLERILDLLGYPVAPGDATKTLPLLYASGSGILATHHFNPFRLFALSRIY